MNRRHAENKRVERRIAVSIVLTTGALAAGLAESACRGLLPDCGMSRTVVDASTLDGKVLCGYQGWFNTPGDGTNFGFGHWGNGLERPDGGRFVVDMWPDTSE